MSLVSKLQIRQAVPADASEIHRLIVALCVYEKYDPETTIKTSVESLTAQLEQSHPPFRCLLAQREERVVGFALFFFNYSTWRGRPGLYLEDLFVDIEYRKQGIATKLLQALAQEALERGCARMEWMVLDWNMPAIEFYRSLGAQMMEGWTTCRLDTPAIEALARRSTSSLGLANR